MKIYRKLFLAFCMCSMFIGLFSSCKNASKYADDIWKSKTKNIKPPRKNPCKKCNATGNVYDVNWNLHDCPNCVDGWTYINL